MQNLTVSTPSQKISSIGNQFVNGNEIKAFHIHDSPSCFYIPYGVHEFFANIEVLTVNFCGLKTVTKEDLKPLQHLRGLYLQNNELSSLSHDLFSHNPNIEEINLCDNKLQNVAVGVFKPLKNLRKVEILRNLCIDESAIKSTEVEILIRNVKEKCPPKILTHLPEIEGSENSVDVAKNKVNEMEKRIQALELKIKRFFENVCEMKDTSEL